MFTRWIFAIATLVLCFTSVSLWAHHSAVLFDISKTFTVTGTLTKVDWRNPHVEIFVDAKSDNNTIETWELETGAPAWFRTRNLAKGNFENAIGQMITVEGVRAKDGSPYGYLYKIVFPDRSSFDLR
jgi:hypothetical protein